MLSIIVCSKNRYPDAAFAKNIAETVGLKYELLHINEIRNEISYFIDTLNLNLPVLRKLCIVPEIYVLKYFHFPVLFLKRKGETHVLKNIKR